MFYGLIGQLLRLPCLSPYRVVYGEPCYFAIEIEHIYCSAIKILNYDLNKAGEEKRLQLSKLNEIRDEVHETTRCYKERNKLFHDRHILRKEFALGMKVLLYDSKLHIFLGKLRSR